MRFKLYYLTSFQLNVDENLYEKINHKERKGFHQAHKGG